MSALPPAAAASRAVELRARAWRALDPLLSVVFPSACAACSDPLASPSAGPLCPACWQSLPRHTGAMCACGAPLGRGVEAPCGRCRRGLSPFARGASLGPFEGALRVLVHELKYRGRRRVGARLAELLLAEPAVRALLTKDALLVPVPLHPARLAERGYNQAELLAAELGRGSGVECCESALVRRKPTAPQAGLSSGARRRNVAGAFAVRRKGHLAGRPLVLVDDVATTGATAAACARALRQAGAGEVRLLTVARVP